MITLFSNKMRCLPTLFLSSIKFIVKFTSQNISDKICVTVQNKWNFFNHALASQKDATYEYFCNFIFKMVLQFMDKIWVNLIQQMKIIRGILQNKIIF